MIKNINNDRKLLLLCAFAAAGIFLLDISIPLGVAGGVPYIILVLFSLWSPRRSFTINMAITGSVLTLLGLFLSPPGGIPWMVYTNRGLALFAIWITAILAMQHKKMLEKLMLDAVIFKNSFEGILVTDTNTKILTVNPGFEKITGYSAKETIGQNIEVLSSEKHGEAFYKDLWDSLIENDQWMGEIINKRKNGELYAQETSITAIRNEAGTITNYASIFRDITERKLAEEALNQSLRDKDLLVKEIHHRTKNNLVVIRSLLKLQSIHIKDEKSREYFIESQNRVKAMSMIHERLYKTGNLNNINVSDYIRSLVKMLYNTYKLSASRIGLNIKVPDIELDVDIIIPCGLIVNELISNAFKYAFPDEITGEITIELVENNDKECTLTIRDNGIGIPEDFDIYNTESLGMQIVTSLVDQINGSLELIRDSGTEFRITFQTKGYSE
jgi:hypothetical protein